MSTDEESDCVVICPPNGEARHEDVMSGSHDEDSPKRKEAPDVVDSHMDNSAQEDMPASRHSAKLVNEQKSSLPNSSTKPAITGQKGSKQTAPQPFALATKRRVSGEVSCTSVSHSTSNGEKNSDRSSSSPASMAKKVLFIYTHACIMLCMLHLHLYHLYSLSKNNLLYIFFEEIS